jgi:hypothetical protein
LAEAKERFLGFRSYYQPIAKAFERMFICKALQTFLAKMNQQKFAKAE